jgi:hypothetical protein
VTPLIEMSPTRQNIGCRLVVVRGGDGAPGLGEAVNGYEVWQGG